MNHRRRPDRAAAIVAALSMLMQPTAHLFAAMESQGQPAKPAATPAPKPAAAPAPTSAAPNAQPGAKPSPAAAAATPVDGGWPRTYSLPSEGSILVYQPQISSWDKQAHLVAFSAVSYRSKAGEKPALGTIKIEADTKVAVSDRLVNFQAMKIVEATFSTLQKEQVREITATIDQAIPGDDRLIALDRVLANLDKSAIVPKNVEGIKADPPAVFFSKTPAVMVNLDGDPIWSPIKENDLKFAVNTNWDLFQHVPTNTYYLRNNDVWLKASDVKGPWTPAGKLPDSFTKLPAEDNWTDVKANLPGKTIEAAAVPRVFVSQQPGELILLTGEPRYLLVQGTELLWVSNTESDVFRMGKTGPVYYLVAGRWFSAPDFTGPWTFATPSLPADFKKIPLEHERSRVLASVPGTDQAAEGVLLAQIPQTARVNKKEVKAPEVAFTGDPQFTPIETTTVERAVNTDKDVFKVAGSYYMCYQGVWFVGTSASGPWEVAGSVPQEIYQIPVSSPANHVTYVTIEESSDDAVVFAAAAGYTGMMVAWGCTVWGSGYYYPPYVGYGGFYPYYYPHFPTYGYSASYNPWTGAVRAQRRRLWSLRRRRRGRPLQSAHRNLRSGRGRLRTVRRTRRGAGLQPPHGDCTRRHARDRTCMEAGVPPACSVATIGPRPTATPTGRPGPPRARSGPTRAPRSPGAGRAAAPWASVMAATSTPERTATSIGKTEGTGRSTTTADGRIPTGSRRRRPGRPTDRPRPARWIAAPRISSIAMPPRAARAPSGPATTGTTGAAAPGAAVARVAIEAVAAARARAAAAGGADAGRDSNRRIETGDRRNRSLSSDRLARVLCHARCDRKPDASVIAASSPPGHRSMALPRTPGSIETP